MSLRKIPQTPRDARSTTGPLWLLFVLAAALLWVSGCGAREAEPASIPPVAQADSLLADAPAALTTAAPTLPPPPLLLEPTAAVAATRTAAAAPPTPPVTTIAETGAAPVAQPPALPALADPATGILPTPSGIYSWTLKVPILMYHYVSTPPADADKYRTDLSVTPDMFRQQMAYLRDNGYTTIDFYELTRAIVGHAELPPKPVLLTFDDGYLDNYEAAFPILSEFGHKGTFFIITEFVDQGREGYMTWPMIEEMARAGQRIESHSRNHPDLVGKPHDALIWQVLGAQETLAAHIGYRPRYFCYPGGTYDEAAIQMLRDLDYWGAVTTENGTWHGFDNRYEWKRVRVRYTTTTDIFAQLVDLEGTIAGKPPG